MKRILNSLFVALILISALKAQSHIGGFNIQSNAQEIVINTDKASRARSGQESTTKYFMENDIGAFWYWPSAEHFSSSVGYSFVTIHGFTSVSSENADVVKGVYRGLGLGFFTVQGNTAVALFGHGRFMNSLVIDIGYTFSSSVLKGFYSSLGYGIPIRLDKSTFILIDIGIAYIGSPTLFTRIGLLL